MMTIRRHVQNSFEKLNKDKLSQKRSKTVINHINLPTPQPTLTYSLQTCPQSYHYQHQPLKYIHNMYFDYGRLNQPIKKIPLSQKSKHFGQKNIENDTKCKTNQKVNKELITNETQRRICTKTKENRDEILTTVRKETNLKKTNKSLGRLSRVQALQNSQRKKKHYSRIIKMVVPGGKMETKIINYPDTSQYLKLTGLLKNSR